MKFLLGAFLLLISTYLFGQQNTSTITITVLFETHKPAEGVTGLLLKSSDSSIYKTTTTNTKGIILFKNIEAGNYLILLKQIGYKKSLIRSFQISSNQNLTLDTVILNKSNEILKEVTITSKRPYVEIQPGKVTLNVQNSIASEGNSAYEILQQSPGVKVDGSTISVIGRQAALVTINGKATGISGEDLASLLKGMQSNSIEKIELITGGSAKYDASGAGIVNIVLKKDKALGFNGSISLNAGYGAYYKSNFGITFNDREKKFNIFGNYNLTNNLTFHDFWQNNFINQNNTNSEFESYYHAKTKNQSNSFSFGADYFLTPKHTIGFLINGLITADDISKYNDLKIKTQQSIDSTLIANSNVNRYISQLTYNLNYIGKLNDKGMLLTADFNYSNYNRASKEYIYNKFFNSEGLNYRPDSLLQNLTPSNINIWIAKADFSTPLSKNTKFETGIKFSYVNSDNNITFGPKVNDVYKTDYNYSGGFIYKENINATYLNLENTIGKFQTTTGLRIEQSSLSKDFTTTYTTQRENFIDLFPQFLITYPANENNSFSISYNRTISRPKYPDLNPFRRFSNLYFYFIGNPELKPEYSHNIEITYSYKQAFSTTFYSNIINDAFEFPFYSLNNTTEVLITTVPNLGNVYNNGFRFNGNFNLTKWWSSNIDLDASYQRYVVYPQNGNLNKGTQDFIITGTQNLTLSKTMVAEIYGFYESPTFYGLKKFQSSYYLNATLSKKLFNNLGSLKLNVSDIFNTKRDRYAVNYQNINFTHVDKVESQIVKLSFSYKFGKSTVKASKRHDSGNQEELKRILGEN
jgi:outer membrane receptor protein involved in Fe transport